MGSEHGRGAAMRPSRSPFPHSQDSATIPRKQGADMSRTRVGVFAHIQTAAGLDASKPAAAKQRSSEDR